MSLEATKIVGFLVVGGLLVGLADVAPDAAIGLAAVVALGVLLAHSSELSTLAADFTVATGH